MPSGFARPAPPQWRAFLEAHPDQAGGPPCAIVLTETKLDQLEEINATVNRFLYRRDIRDTWRLLDFQHGPAAGDCEDLALTKRARLGRLGWPLGALRLVICETRAGQGHMVLCVVTDLGDYIVDNRVAAVRPWSACDYTWRTRWQGDRWVMLLNP